MSLILAYRNRGLTRHLVMLNASGNPIVPGTNDVLRIIIGHEGKLGTNFADAELTFTSSAPTSNGSSITKSTALPAENIMRLDAQDLTFPTGIYTLIFEFLDVADANENKNIDRQVFSLQET